MRAVGGECLISACFELPGSVRRSTTKLVRGFASLGDEFPDEAGRLTLSSTRHWVNIDADIHLPIGSLRLSRALQRTSSKVIIGSIGYL